MMKVKDLIEYLKQFEDYDVITQGYSSYSYSIIDDIDNPATMNHKKKWFMPFSCF